MPHQSPDELRLHLEARGVNREDLQDDPIAQFRLWFDEAKEHSPGRWFEPHAMTVATSDPGGAVSARQVLLKEFDEQGFTFYTNYASHKGRQLDVNPKAALLFHWPYLARQVRVEGSVDRVSRQRSEQYFHSRPRGSQLSAAISGQSEVVRDRAALEQAVLELDSRLAGASVPLPDSWGGYLVRPQRIEFWQGRTSRLHDRFLYRLVEGSWSIDRLSP